MDPPRPASGTAAVPMTAVLDPLMRGGRACSYAYAVRFVEGELRGNGCPTAIDTQLLSRALASCRVIAAMRGTKRAKSSVFRETMVFTL